MVTEVEASFRDWEVGKEQRQGRDWVRRIGKMMEEEVGCPMDSKGER
jgi:hypothetical protein